MELLRVQQFVFDIVPMVMCRMRAVETEACLDSTIQTQLLPEEETLQWRKDDIPIRSHSDQRHFANELKQLLVDAKQITIDAEELEEEKPDDVNTFEARRLSISENRKRIGETLKKYAQLNKVINGYDAIEYEENQTKFINEIVLMLILPAFKDYDRKPQDMQWTCGSSSFLQEPLAGTTELIQCISLETFQLGKFLPMLRNWITKCSAGVTAREELERGLSIVASLEKISKDQQADHQRYLHIRTAIAQKALLQEPLAKRMEQLQGYDRLIGFVCRERATEVKELCKRLLDFVQSNLLLFNPDHKF